MRTRLPLLIAAPSALVLVAALIASAGASAADTPRRPACTITGTGGNDELHGTTGPDVICARGGRDHVFARGGDDVLLLGPGNDYGDGDAGNDRIFGGAGRDIGEGGRGEDRIFLQRGGDFAQDGHGAAACSGAPGATVLRPGTTRGTTARSAARDATALVRMPGTPYDRPSSDPPFPAGTRRRPDAG